jgi:hypothetical protein
MAKLKLDRYSHLDIQFYLQVTCIKRSALHNGPTRLLATWSCTSTALFVTVIVLGLSIFINSPLHTDDSISAEPCPFCKLQHLSAEPAAAPLQVALSATVFWLLIAEPPLLKRAAVPCTRFGRAPPLPLFAA